jgi:hypothetical protein
MATSKTPEKPQPVIDKETGRKIYPGSLSMNTELSDDQKDDIMAQLKKEPQTPTTLVANTDGLDPRNPHHGEAVRRHLATLERNGHVGQVKDERGKLLGWQAKDE